VVTVFRPEHVELNLSMLSGLKKNVEHLRGAMKMTPSSVSRTAVDDDGASRGSWRGRT
jgi:hypothetical protein